MITKILASLFLRGKPGKDGIWDYLGKRSADRSRVDLEKARNDGTQKLIPMLKPGTVLTEGGPDWHREIRIPEALSPTILLADVIPEPPNLPLPAAELEPAPRRELEPPSPDKTIPERQQGKEPTDETMRPCANE